MPEAEEPERMGLYSNKEKDRFLNTVFKKTYEGFFLTRLSTGYFVFMITIM